MVVKILVRLRFSRNLADLDKVYVDDRFSEIAESGNRRYLVCWFSLRGVCKLQGANGWLCFIDGEKAAETPRL